MKVTTVESHVLESRSSFHQNAPTWEIARPETNRESDIFDASLRAISHRRQTDNSPPPLKLVEFSLELPVANANVVQLTADFTGWEESPLNMIQFEGGTWSITVPLPTGIYAYGFLVDGEWHEDPRAICRDTDEPGRAKAFVKVR